MEVRLWCVGVWHGRLPSAVPGQLYILPLTEACKTSKPILPAADIKRIFSLWQSILEFQSKVWACAKLAVWAALTLLHRGRFFSRSLSSAR